MTPRERLLARLHLQGPLAIAFSGGTDSTLLAEIARRERPGRVLLIHVDSPLITTVEKSLARHYLNAVETACEIMVFDPLSQAEIVSNPADRCYRCKTAIMQMMKEAAARAGFPCLADGTNADDRAADERPGLRALAELGIISPLADAGLTKAEIRRWALELGLPNADTPESACLATRIPAGIPLSLKHLRAIDTLESQLRDAGFPLCRVRLTSPDSASIEVAAEKVPELQSMMADPAQRLESDIFMRISVDSRGYGTRNAK